MNCSETGQVLMFQRETSLVSGELHLPVHVSTWNTVGSYGGLTKC